MKAWTLEDRSLGSPQGLSTIWGVHWNGVLIRTLILCILMYYVWVAFLSSTTCHCTVGLLATGRSRTKTDPQVAWRECLV